MQTGKWPEDQAENCYVGAKSDARQQLANRMVVGVYIIGNAISVKEIVDNA